MIICCSVNKKLLSRRIYFDEEVIPLVDIAILYDNTESFRRFAVFGKGRLLVLSHIVPCWYNKYLGDRNCVTPV